MKRDLHSHISARAHIPAQVLGATHQPRKGVDTAGFGALDFIIAIGAVSNISSKPTSSWDFKLQESDKADAGFTDVLAGNDVLVGSALPLVTEPDAAGIFLSVGDAADDEKVYRIGYRGYKRYVRVVATAVNDPGNTPISVVAVLGKPHLAPTQD